jgi:AraC family transcriptional regulator
MREPYSFGALASTGGLRVGDVQVSSSRVEHLVKQAMNYFETDRKAAWRCLSDASTLLGTGVGDSGVSAPSAPGCLSLKNARPGGLANWQARRVLAYIEANLGSKLEIGDLANLVALSKSHFSRAFKHSLGMPPMEYVAVRRVERAKVMISSTRELLAEIALACGFADQAHLNRRFRDLIGMSPGRWRRSNMVAPKSTPHYSAEVQTTTALRSHASAEVGLHELR